MSRVPRTLVLAACTAAVSAAVAPGSVAAASTPGLRVGSAALIPAAANVIGALSSATKLDVTVALEPRDPASLAAFASAVSTPGSDVYRDYITPAQFAQRFGPTEAQIAAVRSSLLAHGLDPGTVSANGLAIPVTATAGTLADALSISFSRVQLAGGRIAYASTAAPLLDASVAPLIQSVVGLNDLSVPQPLALRRDDAVHSAALSAPHVVTGGPQPCAAASAAAPGQMAHTADEIASAYGFPGLYTAGDEGAGQTIAVYELEPDDPTDIAAYQACYGTSASVSYVPVDGGAGTGSGSGEAALDIEDLVGLAPKANLIVYQGPNANTDSPGSGPYDTYNEIISEDRAKIISTSWGQCEPMEGATDADAENTLFEEAASQGQTILSAAGDDGSEDCFVPQQNFEVSAAVDDPSSQPYVTGVGGTSLGAVGPPPSETVWNNGGGLQAVLGTSAGAGGGGISTIWNMPVYQADAPASLNVINAGSAGTPCGATSGYCREVPDVSADADPYTGYLIYYDGAWTGIGGTSAATPVWAALVALANASPACSGTTVGFANPALYRAAGSPQYAGYFHDVTSGDNDFTGTDAGKYAAGPGYDMATGLGTPIASALAVALCDTVTVTNPGAQVTTLGRRVSLHIAATDASNATLAYRATGLPAGLSIGEGTGEITGAPTQAGTSTVVVQTTDTGGRTSSTSFAWSIRYPTVLSSSPPVTRCGVTLRRRTAHQAGALRLTGSLRSGSVAIADARGTVLAVKLSGTTVTITAGKKVLGTITGATGGLHEITHARRALELASGNRHFLLIASSTGSVVSAKVQECSYAASRSQRLITRPGHAARGTLYLESSTGVAAAGASISITDAKHVFTVRTGRSGKASFTLAKGPNRSISAAYAGGSDFAPAGLKVQVHNERVAGR